MALARITHPLQGGARPELDEARTWIGDRVVDSNGSGVGRLEDVWVDADSGEPAWLLLREGRVGPGRHKLIPFHGATAGGGQIWVPHERKKVRSSPEIGAEGILTAEFGEQLRAHYGAAVRRPAVRR